MDFIKPTAITDALFLGSNVPENDYQEWDSGTSYAVGDTVIVDTPDIHKIFECLVSQSAGLSADVLDEDCSDISDWSDQDTGTGVSEVDPVGQFRFDTNSVGGGNVARRERTISSPPDNFSLEIKTYFDAIADTDDHFEILYCSSNWQFFVRFMSSGLFVCKAGGSWGEVGTNIVKYGSTAARQTWRFEVDKTTPSTATVEVFLKEEGGDFVSQGTVDCDYEAGGFDGYIKLVQYGRYTSDRITHIDYIKIATGLGKISTTDDTPNGNSDWLDLGPTNRWACFDGTIGNQSTQAESMTYILAPGEVDGLALLNIESTSVRVDVVDDDNTEITGTVSLAAMKISAVDGTAFVDFGLPAVLTNGVAQKAKLTVFDSTGKKLVGYIKAQGTGETYGAELITNGDFSAWTDDDPDGWSITESGANIVTEASGVGARIVSDGTVVAANQSAAGTTGMLLAHEIVVAAVVSGAVRLQNTGSVYAAVVMNAVQTYNWNCTNQGNNHSLIRSTACDVTISSVSIKQVLTPSTTGVTITSTPDGSTYNWESQESGFNYNDASGYSYTLSLIYYKTVTTGPSKTDLVLLDLPLGHPAAEITITIENTGGTAKVGEIIVGIKTYLGAMRYSPSIGITDYSTKAVDTYGHYSIVPRTFAKRMNCSLIILNTVIDEIIRLLTLYRSTELVWVGDANYNSLIIYGYYKDFQVVFARPNSSDCALEIEGLT